MMIGEAVANQASSSHGLEPMVLVGIAAMLAVAKLSGGLFERAGQPAVLGELLGGILVANLSLIGFNGAEFLKTSEIIGALAQLGVIILRKFIAGTALLRVNGIKSRLESVCPRRFNPFCRGADGSCDH